MCQIATLLREQGDDVTVAYGRDSTDFPNTYKIGGKASTWLHGVLSRLADAHCYGSVTATRRFVRFLKEYKPDLVHLHNIHGYYLNDKILFRHLKKENIPVIWTMHDGWVFTGHCACFDSVGCEKWKTGCNHCPLLKNYPTSLVIDRSAPNFRRKKQLYTSLQNMWIVTPSNWLAGLVQESFLANTPIRVIPNGIDLSVFKPCDCSLLQKDLNLQNKKVVLGVATAWSRLKGLDDFKKLSRMLPKQYQVVLVGCDPETCADTPEILAIPRTENVQMLAQFYSLAEVFVNLTYNDNFPTVNLEALACGTPVITYNTGGSPESLDETCGIVVPQGDLNQVVREIYQLEQTPIDPKRCIARAMQFDKEKRFLEYTDLIHATGTRSL